MANRHNQALWAAVAGLLIGVLAGCTTAATPSNTAPTSTAPTSTAHSSTAHSSTAVSNTAVSSTAVSSTALSDHQPLEHRPSEHHPFETASPNTTGLLPAASSPADGVPVTPVRVLQLNLCNSGIAACYTGQSLAQAATVIREQVPDLVTLNEICEGDLPTVERALAEVIPDGDVVSAFQGARDRRTGDVYRCVNGEPYGIGLISRWPSVPGSAAGGGIYPSQDTEDPEERAWLCLAVAASPAMTVCTTHLAYTKLEVAAAQCKYLFGTVIAELRELDPVAPVVFAGDLNLGSGDSARSCVPAGSALAGDGGMQLVVATPEFVVSGSERIDLRGTTDHPGLLVTLAPPASG